jgi:uncharacterized protein YlxW (UPF0749 family)
MAQESPRSRFTRRRRPDPPTPQEARNRLRRALGHVHLSRGHVLTALLTVLLGVALMAQVRVTDEAGLRELRETELVALLDDVTNRADSLREEVRELEADLSRLQGGQGDQAAAAAAQERLESYQILAGTVPVQGPGITVRVDDPGAVITQTMLLDGIQELRDAGAEAIQIGSVRVVASSYVGTDAAGDVVLDGVPLRQPYSITAVGDAHTLAGAMAIPGGFTDSLRGAGATVTVLESDIVRVEALHQPREAQYARPVPSTP